MATLSAFGFKTKLPKKEPDLSKLVPELVAATSCKKGENLGLSAHELLVPFRIPAEVLVKHVTLATLQWSVERDLTLVLLFGGYKDAAKVIADRGWKSASFDSLAGPHEHSNSVVGCVYYAWLVFSILPKGTMWASPAYDPWLCFVARANSGRDSARPGIVGDYNVSCIN